MGEVNLEHPSLPPSLPPYLEVIKQLDVSGAGEGEGGHVMDEARAGGEALQQLLVHLEGKGLEEVIDGVLGGRQGGREGGRGRE